MVSSSTNAMSCGMYPMRGPMKLAFFLILTPRTLILPSCNFFCPTMHDNNVVFPQPDEPNSPYLNRANEQKKDYYFFNVKRANQFHSVSPLKFFFVYLKTRYYGRSKTHNISYIIIECRMIKR